MKDWVLGGWSRGGATGRARPLAAALVAAGAVALGLAAPCAAQPGSVPAEVIGSQSALNPQQVQELQAYVEANSANLTAERADQVRRDRTRLLEPLSGGSVSPAFRIAYSQVLVPVLAPLATNARDLTAINALVIAGEVGTQEAVEAIRAALADARPPVRYQSAYALMRVLASSAGGVPTLRPDQLSEVVRLIQGRLAEEKDPLVQDALVRAALAAMPIDIARSQAMTAVAGTVAAIADAQAATPAPEAQVQVFLRAASGLRDALAAPAQRLALTPEAIRAAAELSGALIRHTVRVASAGGLLESGSVAAPGVASRDLYAQLTSASETLLGLSGQALQQGFAVAPKNLGATLRRGGTQGDATFAVDAGAFIGPQGSLARAPFGFPADRFAP